MADTLRPNGVNQGTLVKWVKNSNDLQTELAADHATNKTLIDEALGKLSDLIHLSKNYPLGNADPVFAIDTNFDVKNTETTLFVANNITYTLADNTSCDTGTSKTITGGNWSAFVIDATNATTLTATWASSSYASEALALAAAESIAFVANKARLGIVTVRAHASGFTAGTDALATGTGGNVAQNTNYYSFRSKAIADLSGTTTAATLSSSAPGTTSSDGVIVS